MTVVHLLEIDPNNFADVVMSQHADEDSAVAAATHEDRLTFVAVKASTGGLSIRRVTKAEERVTFDDPTMTNLVQIHNAATAAQDHVRKFENKEVAARRTGQAVMGLITSEDSEEARHVSVVELRKTEDTKETGHKVRKGRTANGVPARDDVKRVKPGSVRAKVMALMDGTRTAGEIATQVGIDARQVMAHGYCTARDVGVGYKVTEEGKLLALYPPGKGLTDVVREETAA